MSSRFSVSINIRGLRTIFHVSHLSADQRAIQKKDEHRFSILYKRQLRKEQLTCQSKWGWGCMGSRIAVLCWIWIESALNLNNWIQPIGNDSQLLSTITHLKVISRLQSVWVTICRLKKGRSNHHCLSIQLVVIVTIITIITIIIIINK